MERYDYTTQRIFVADDLKTGNIISANRSQANYLLNVLRMKSGSQMLLFNGRHGEWLAKIVATGRKACDLHLISQTRIQPEPSDLLYMFAPLKKGRLDYMVQKAVEMGVGELQPVITRHTQITKINLERLQANAMEAAEQCGILSLPRIMEPMKLDELLDDWNDERTIIYGDEAAEKTDLVSTLSGLGKEKLALLIGPEGGFSQQERQRLRSMDCVCAISLGPRILRADTAAVAALALLQAIGGDWR